MAQEIQHVDVVSPLCKRLCEGCVHLAAQQEAGQQHQGPRSGAVLVVDEAVALMAEAVAPRSHRRSSVAGEELSNPWPQTAFICADGSHLGSAHRFFADTYVVEVASAPRPHAVRFRKPRRLLAALSDERLVEHVRGGDPAAFEVLYDRHSSGLLGFCRHMLRSQADAEDALQQTFIAAHSDILRAGERELHVKAWLYTIARNRCLSTLRARREQPADDEFELVTEDLANEVQQRDDLRALLADVSMLPDDQREALVLAEVGDLSHTDISEVIGCEAAKVKSLVFQARTALIDRRLARETPCEQIREQLATLRGGALRRSHLRHHIEACPGCAEYREEIRRQRAMLAVALPVVPSAALRAKVLGGIGLGGGGTAAGISAAGGLTLATQTAVTKLGIAAALVAGGGAVAAATTTGLPVVGHVHVGSIGSTSDGAKAHSAGVGTSAAAAAATAALGKADHPAPGPGHRSASGSEHGFTPVNGTSNGERARQFAATRGKGNHAGITEAPGHHSHTKAKTRGHVHPTPVAKGHKHTTTTHVKPVPKAAPKTHTAPQPA